MVNFNVDKYNIPPLVKDMITKLRDERSPPHIRNNYKMMLENIMRACQEEVAYFMNTPVQQLPMKRKKPVARKF